LRALPLKERISADLARQRILLRLQELLPKDPPIEYKFTFLDMWSRKIFVSLLRRYDLMPYRYRGQRYTTVMVQAPKSFVAETLWPEFQKISSELDTYLQEVIGDNPEIALNIFGFLISLSYATIIKIRCPWCSAPCDGARNIKKKDIH